MSYSHVRAMVEFAIALMSKLESINKHSFNIFKLRIGEFVAHVRCCILIVIFK